MMSKEKNAVSEQNEDLDLFEDGGIDEVDHEIVGLQPDEVVEAGPNNKANHKLEVKKRLDAYLERKWFRDNGWEDDDDLFDDEFFSESELQDHTRGL